MLSVCVLEVKRREEKRRAAKKERARGRKEEK